MTGLLPRPLAAQPRVDIRNATVSEPDAGTVQASLEVRLSAASADTVTVTYAPLTDGTPPPTIAAACGGDTDVVGPTGTVRFVPGDVSELVPITVCDDTADEPDEIFRLRLTAVTGAVFGERTGRLTIVDNDQPAAALPTVSVDDLAIAEGIAGAVQANVTVRLSAPSNQPVIVVAAPAGGSATAGNACVPGSDAVFLPRPVTIPAGQPSATTPITVCGDVDVESDETLAIALTNPVSATLGDALGQVTITNDDFGALRASVRDTIVPEGDLGSRVVKVTVTLSRPSTERVTVGHTIVNAGTATVGPCGGGGDFTGSAGTVEFAPQQVVGQFDVTICGDVASESSETVLLRLTSPTVATLGDDTGILTIQDDEVARAVVGGNENLAAGVQPARPDLDVDVLGAQFLTQAAPNLAFHTTLKNTGAFQASNVLLRLTLPEDVSFLRVEDNQVGRCAQNGTDASGAVRVDCTATSLPTGAERNVRVIGRTVGSVADSTQYVFAASVDPDNTIAETDERNNTSFLSVTVRAPADLAILSGGAAVPSSAGPLGSPALVPSCAPNEIIEVGLTVRNRGPNRSAPTVIAAQWPTGVAAVGPFSGGPPDPCFERCGVPALDSGQTTTIRLFGRSIEQVLLLQARFRVEPPALDPVASNNSLTVTLCDNR